MLRRSMTDSLDRGPTAHTAPPEPAPWVHHCSRLRNDSNCLGGWTMNWQAGDDDKGAAGATAGRGGGNHGDTLGGLLQLLGADPPAPGTGGDLPVATRALAGGATLFHENTPVDAIYAVRVGTFKAVRTEEDGYEQVLLFYSRADVVGLESLTCARHPHAVVALEDSSVYVIAQHDLVGLGRRCPSLHTAVLMAASTQLARRDEVVHLMAAVAAEARLARFLLQYSRRMAACGQSPLRLLLRMNRRDIASLLGLAHETISRSFGALAAAGLVRVRNREVEIRDLAGLEDFARSTRGPLEAPGAAALRALNRARPGWSDDAGRGPH